MAALLRRFALMMFVIFLAASANAAEVGSDGLPVNESSVSATGAQSIDLRTQLEKGLLARREVEFKFITRVVTAVEEGRLPRSVVDSTFLWAKRKNFHRIQYFQFALEARAKKLGVTI